MGAAASLTSTTTSVLPKSSALTLCASALGNGGSGAQATKLPDTSTVIVHGGGASVSITYAGASLINDLNYFSMRLGGSGGPMPTIEGHTLTGLSGRKAMILGGLTIGRRSSGFAGGFSNKDSPMLMQPSEQPVKTSMGSGWVLHAGRRRASGSSLAPLLRRGSKSDPEIPSQWVRQQFLGQPPIRRAYHSAHRALVGGKERIVIYGGEVGNTLSRPSSVGSMNSRSSRGEGLAEEDEKRRREHEERLNERLALLQLENKLRDTGKSPLNVGSNPPSRRGSLTSTGSDGRSPAHFNFSDSGNVSDLEKDDSMNDEEFAKEKPRRRSLSFNPPLSPMALALEAPKKDEFLEQDDDDGFLYVLDCSSWVWKAGTCATETQEEEQQQDREETFTSSRSYYPPGESDSEEEERGDELEMPRARHTATPLTEDGNYTIVFGGYKTKSTTMLQKDEDFGDNTYTSNIGNPLNDAWQLQTVGHGDGVRFIWKRLKNLGAPPCSRWGHASVSIGSGAMVVYGGCGETVDLDLPRNPVSEVGNALDDCYVFHLGGFAGSGGPFRDSSGTLSESVDMGDGLWVRVPGNCGLGKRVCPAATVAGGAIVIFGGTRGKNDTQTGKSKISGVQRAMKDARVVDAKLLLHLDLTT